MDQKAFFANMGDLVNRVIGRLVNQVLAQLDIGEEESQNLSTLCRSLQGLQEIFMDGDRVSHQNKPFSNRPRHDS